MQLIDSSRLKHSSSCRTNNLVASWLECMEDKFGIWSTEYGVRVSHVVSLLPGAPAPPSLGSTNHHTPPPLSLGSRGANVVVLANRTCIACAAPLKPKSKAKAENRSGGWILKLKTRPKPKSLSLMTADGAACMPHRHATEPTRNKWDMCQK